MITIEARLAELGLKLPEPAAPKGLYVPALVVGDLLYTSGHLPIGPDGRLVVGRVGQDLDVAAAAEAAKLVGLGILATLKATLGDLDRVRQVVKILGLVNATSDFTQHPAVVNGCSELLRDVFGEEKGVGTRSALGAGSLPLNVPVEIEAVFQIDV